MFPLIIGLGSLLMLVLMTPGRDERAPAGGGGDGGGGDGEGGGGDGEGGGGVGEGTSKGGGGVGTFVDPKGALPPDVMPTSVVDCLGTDLSPKDFSYVRLGEVQGALISLGYLAPTQASGKTSVDAKCGPSTQVAIAKYRKDRGLIAGDFVNARMLAMLRIESPCSFSHVFWVTKPELWGVTKFAGRLDAYVVVHPKNDPFGSYSGAVAVKKRAATGTEAAKSPCPYAEIVEVLEPSTSVKPPLFVGAMVARRVPVPTLAGGFEWKEVPWSLEE